MNPDHRPASRQVILWTCVVFLPLAVLHMVVDTPIYGGFLALAVVFRAWLSWQDLKPPRPWLLILFSAASLGLLAVTGTADGYNALAIRALVILAGLKLLETKTVRDVMVLAFLGFFLVATLFLLEQDMLFTLGGFAIAWALVAVLVANSAIGTKPSFTKAAKSGARLVAFAIPFAALLFLIFPRLQGPLWQLDLDSGAGISGLSDSMQPGGISQLVLSEAIAFRAEFADGEIPSRNSLYWRGPALWSTDGRRWTRRLTSASDSLRIDAQGQRTQYQLILEPHGQKWILALDVPAGSPPKAFITADGEIMSDNVLFERTTKTLNAWTDGRLTGLSTRQRSAGLQLPEDISERTLALVDELKATRSTGRQKVAAVLTHFSANEFAYTLQPPRMGRDPVDAFLFDHRVGFCEHYASAFTLLMRLMGLPARVVTGYLGGEVNPNNGQLIVRQSDAHAWSEVWVDGAWLRVDPTAVIAPERVSLGLDVPTSLARGIPLFGSQPDFLRQLARRAQWLWDAVEMAWYAEFVNFSDQRQHSLLKQTGLQALGSVGVALVLAFSIIAVMAVTAAWVLRERRKDIPPEVRLFEKYCRRLARRGLPREPGEGPLAFAARVRDGLDTESARLSDAIAKSYAQLRYGREEDSINRDAALSSLESAVKPFRPLILTEPR